MLRDSYGRTIADLRISVTDRCNFRCFYCRPDLGSAHGCRDSILSFEEIAVAASAFVRLGISKIRLTGGEPLLRRGLAELVASLSRLRAEGLREIAMTTNGFALAGAARDLKDAGLDRVTVSLDSLSPENFREITGGGRLSDVLDGIAAAIESGLRPVKVNAVVVRGRNDSETADLARFARETGAEVRFIEFMPLDAAERWKPADVVTAAEIRESIEAVYPLVPVPAEPASTARLFGFADGAPGAVGLIAPVTERFCGACSRIRLTADGQIRTCLFSRREHDLRSLIRLGAGGEHLESFIRHAADLKEPGHSISQPHFARASRPMASIGG